MEMIEVESSQINKIGHDPATLKLVVEFKNGVRYSYDNVTVTVFDELRTAESVGSYFIRNIKKSPELYPYKKMEKEEG